MKSSVGGSPRKQGSRNVTVQRAKHPSYHTASSPGDGRLWRIGHSDSLTHLVHGMQFRVWGVGFQIKREPRTWDLLTQTTHDPVLRARGLGMKM